MEQVSTSALQLSARGENHSASTMCERHESGSCGIILENDESFLVNFEEPRDHLNPKDWPTLRKWTVTFVLSLIGFNRIMVSTIMAPALPVIAKELDMSGVTSVMALSVYLLATAFGPLLIGPLSEMYGRRPVLHGTSIWFLVWNIVCGFSHTKFVLIAARLLAGFGASAIYTLGGGVLGDVWKPEERGRSLGLYQLIPLLGAAVGPIIGGVITSRTTWRWMFWSTSIFQVFGTILSILVFRETYTPTILRRKALDLRNRTGERRYHTATEKLHRNQSVAWLWRRSLLRPLRLLLSHPIVQIQACQSGFSYGITYLVISSYSEIWSTRYGESISTSGLHYLAMCTGEILGALIGGGLMDMVFGTLKERRGGIGAPELHVPLMPLGLSWSFWASCFMAGARKNVWYGLSWTLGR